MSRLVMKFGGTSVANVERIRNVARHVKREVDAGHEVAIVVSAMAGKTNELVGWCKEAGSHSDNPEYDAIVASGKAILEAAPVDLHDAGGAMRIIGQDRNLPALPRAGIDSNVLQRDRQQPRGDLLAGGHHHVVLAGVMQGREFPRPADQLVSGAGHGRDHHGNLVACVDFALDVAGDVPDARDVGDRSPAEFHHQPCHRMSVARTWASKGALS